MVALTAFPVSPRRSTGALILILLPLLAGCASTRYRPVSDVPVRIGKPYTVRGATYVPAENPAYEEFGFASWYGQESGNMTANGERFRPSAMSAAHRTLPLPTYVEVTALDTGRTILVRINDRGPFAAGRIIDLSRGAAALLGVRTQGVAAVRVRRVEPPEKERAKLRKGKSAVVRANVPETTLADWRARLAQR